MTTERFKAQVEYYSHLRKGAKPSPPHLCAVC